MHYNQFFPANQAFLTRNLLKKSKLRFAPIDFPFVISIIYFYIGEDSFILVTKTIHIQYLISKDVIT